MNQPTVTPPTAPGFYWWRPFPSEAWRVVHIYLASNGPCVDDVDRCNFSGRSISSWERYYVVGEWVQIIQPIDPIREPSRWIRIIALAILWSVGLLSWLLFYISL